MPSARRRRSISQNGPLRVNWRPLMVWEWSSSRRWKPMSLVAGLRPASIMLRVKPKMRLMARSTGKSRTKVPLPLIARDPAFLLQFMEHLARGGVADPVALDDLILRRHRRAGRQLAALNGADDLAADLEVFGRTVFVGGHGVESRFPAAINGLGPRPCQATQLPPGTWAARRGRPGRIAWSGCGCPGRQ